jgi:hypothetical protein
VSLELVEHYLPTPGDVLDQQQQRPVAADAWIDRVRPLGTYALVAPDAGGSR